MEQEAGRLSRSRAFGASRAGGPLNKEPTGPLWRPWAGSREQAGSPDEEPMEHHGAGREPRSKDNGPLELEAVNQESMGLFWIS